MYIDIDREKERYGTLAACPTVSLKCNLLNCAHAHAR